MTTPYDGKVLLVNWLARLTPGGTIDEFAQLIRQKMPNVAGVMLKTSNGRSWQGHLSGDQVDPKAVTGTNRIKEWVDAFGAHDLEVHVWGVPRAKPSPGESMDDALAKEAEKFIQAANVPGVKSVLLDVEMGESYWLGAYTHARRFMDLLNGGLSGDTHIGLILDGRLNRDFRVWVDPWLENVGSLHPMIYPILFGPYQSIEAHIDESFRNLERYGLPIVPMLQLAAAGGRPGPDQIIQQGAAAWARGAAGLSFFRIGSDRWGVDGQPHSGDREYAALARIETRAAPPEAEVPADLPYTWQDVINAVVTVASEKGGDWNRWLSDSGYWRLFVNDLRPLPYTGPPIELWPLEAELRLAILKLLDLDSAELIRITIDAQNKRDRERKVESALRRKKGSIVGIHGAPGFAAPRQDTWDRWIELLTKMGVRWYKQVDNGDPNDLGPNTMFAWAKRLKAEGIEPIIRYMMPEQFPESLPEAYFQKMRRYAEQGIVWAEIGNEPNLEIEWKSEWRSRGDHKPVHQANPQAIEIIAETWIKDARKALDAGARPAFYAFAPTDWKGNFHPQYSSVLFTGKVVSYLAQHRRAETVDIFNRGGWIAVHAATYEQPNNFDPFSQPGAVWDMTLRGYEVPLKAFRDAFGGDLNVDEIVVMSTEGGVFTPNSTSMAGHERLGTDEEHGRRVVQMFRYLERHSPLQAMCPWCISVGDKIGHFDEQFKHDGWIEEINGELRPRTVYERMRQYQFDSEREVESIEAPPTLVKLSVPYISQFDPTASTRNADCGPTSMAMIINAGKAPADHLTVDAIYEKYLPNKGLGEFTFVSEMVAIGEGEGLAARRVQFADADKALVGLKDLIRQEQPFVALVNYAAWDEIAKNNFKGGHFVVVTGFDEEHVFVHDPIFRGNRRAEGEHFVWRNDKFLAGWGSGNLIENPDYVAIVTGKKMARLT